MRSVHAVYDDLRHANLAGQRVSNRLGTQAEVSVFADAEHFEMALPNEDRCIGLGAVLGALWTGLVVMIVFGAINAAFAWIPISAGFAIGGLVGALYGVIVGAIAGSYAVDPRLGRIEYGVRHGQPVVMARIASGKSAKTARRMLATSEGALAVG